MCRYSAWRDAKNAMNAINSARLFGKYAGVEKENHTRSSRSSMIRRLKPVSFFVTRNTRFMSTELFTGPTRESIPGHPRRTNPFSKRRRSRAFFVHLFRTLCLPFSPATWLSLAPRGAAAAKWRPTASRKSSPRLRRSCFALRSSFLTIASGIETINRAITRHPFQ